MSHATLDLSICAFSRSFGIIGRTTRSHVIFLGSVGPSCKKYLHVQSHSVFTRSDFTSRSFNGYNQQNFGGCKIWRELYWRRSRQSPNRQIKFCAKFFESSKQNITAVQAPKSILQVTNFVTAEKNMGNV